MTTGEIVSKVRIIMTTLEIQGVKADGVVLGRQEMEVLRLKFEHFTKPAVPMEDPGTLLGLPIIPTDKSHLIALSISYESCYTN